MSTIYALGCRFCMRKVDVARTSSKGLEQGLACVTHQQLINFLSEHSRCHLFFADPVEDGDLLEYKDDTDFYPDQPIEIP